jgi:hypothetical protein
MRSAGSGEVASARRRVALDVGHFCLQALLCACLWVIVGRAYDLTGYPGRLGVALALLLPGCVSLGALSRLFGRGRFLASAAVAFVTMAILTEVFRVYVVDFAGGPPTFWATFRVTASINAPYAVGLSLLPFGGWYGTKALQRRREVSARESNGAAEQGDEADKA